MLSAAVPALAGSGFTLDGAFLSKVDTGDGWYAIGWVEGGRAVLYGFQPYGSQTREQVPPVDLFGGAPEWLPWERLIDTPMLAFLRWWDGASWSHAPMPDGMDDGAGYTDGTVEDLYLELGEDYDALVEAYGRLIEAAEGRAVDRPVVDALLEPLEEAGDVEAALRIAERTGVAPGSARPEIAAGTGEPAGRRVQILDAAQVSGVITTAMRGAGGELPDRPEAAPGRARALLVERVRAKGEITAAYVGHPRPGFAYRDSRGGWLDPEVSNLLTAWREEEADAAHGRWLLARIRQAGGDEVAVEAVYDHLPAWWKSGFMPDAQIEALRAEMRRRDPRWRPAWADLLDEDFLTLGAPPELCWHPNLRWSGAEDDVERMLRSGTLSSAPLEVWETARSTLVELAARGELLAVEPTGDERVRQVWLGVLADAEAGRGLPADWFADKGARCPEPVLRRLMKQAELPRRESPYVPRNLLDVAQTHAWPQSNPRRDGATWTGSTDFAAMTARPPVDKLSRFVRDIGLYANVDYMDVLERVWAEMPEPLQSLIDRWRAQTEAGGLPALEAGLAYLAPLAEAHFDRLDEGFLSGWRPAHPVDALVLALRTGIPGELEFPFAERAPVRHGMPALVVQHGEYLTVVTHPARVYGPEGEILTRRVTMPPLFPDVDLPFVHEGPLLWFDGTDLRMADRHGIFRADGHSDDHDSLLTYDAEAGGPDYPETAEVVFPGADQPTRVTCGGGRLRFHAPGGTETAQAPFGIAQQVEPGAQPVPPPGWWRNMRPVDPAGSAALRQIDHATASALAEAALLGPRETARQLDELLPNVTAPPLRTAVIEQAALAARCLHGLARLGTDGLPSALSPLPGLRVRRNVKAMSHARLLADKLRAALNAPPGLVEVTDVPDFGRRRLPFLQLGNQALSIVWPWTTPYERSKVLDELRAWASTPFGDGSGHWQRVFLTATERFEHPEGEIWHLSGSALLFLDEATGIRYAPDPDSGWNSPPGWEWSGQSRQGWGSPEAVRRLSVLLDERGPLPADPAHAIELAERTGMPRWDAAHALFGDASRTAAEIADLYLDPATGERAKPRLTEGTRTRLRELMMPADPADLWTDGPDIERAATWQNNR